MKTRAALTKQPGINEYVLEDMIKIMEDNIPVSRHVGIINSIR